MIEELINDLGIGEYILFFLLAMVASIPILLHLFLKRFKFYWIILKRDLGWAWWGFVILSIYAFLASIIAGIIFGLFTYAYYEKAKNDKYEEYELNDMYNNRVYDQDIRKYDDIISVILAIYFLVFILIYFEQ